MTASPLLVPIELQAFRLNEAVCGTGDEKDHSARIAPITQPNYTFLRLDNYVIQNDVLGHTDLHNSAPASVNPRMSDLGKMPTTPHRHRQGIYLHWTLPRCYRSGVSMADSTTAQRRNDERLRRGLPVAPPVQGGGGDAPKVGSSTPGYIQPPTRWLVVRKIDKDTIRPKTAKDSFNDCSAWVIESDHLWSLGDIPLTADLQIDVSPFVTSGGKDISNPNIKQQAEVFIGRKTPLDQWTDDPNQTHANLSLLRSSNQLFADYQLHNSNVFSMVDNFEYVDAKETKYLDSATASYYLLGWHWDNDSDPLWDGTATVEHAKRLAGLFMSFPESKTPIPDQEAWLKASDSVRLMIHGAMYDVDWDVSSKPPNVPADDFASRLRNTDVPAMSVGTTPLDALITYCTARQAKKDDDPASIEKLEEDILAIQSLLHARDDGVDGQRQAKDTVYNWNFNRGAGGRRYYLGGESGDGKPTDPDPNAKSAVTEINKLQIVYDSCERMLQRLRWDMFSRWWKYVSDARYDRSDDATNIRYRDATAKLSQRISGLKTLSDSLKDQINAKLPPPPNPPTNPATPPPTQVTQGSSPVASSATVGTDPTPPNPLKNAKTGTLPFYYRSQDPTVLVGGIDSGWALDYLDDVMVRLPNETIDSTTVPDTLKSLIKDLIDADSTCRLPAVFTTPVTALITEFWALRPDGGDSGTAPAGKFYPQFHDQKTADLPQMPAPAAPGSATTPGTTATEAAPVTPLPARWRDRWSGRQPWFPLFVEWEVEYTHVPINYWTLSEKAVRLSDNTAVRYGIDVPSGKPLYDELAGKRDRYRLSGRTLILPQPSFSLAAKVKQLFADTPGKLLDPYLSPAERQNLLDNINMLSYLSAPLTGVTDGLLTLAQGTHIKPENKVLTDLGVAEVKPIQAAEFGAAGLTLSNLGLIDSNSALTPFAAVTNFDSAINCPFKPVTHGQFRFFKFNIIDKFGQTLVANDPKPTAGDPPAVYPAISDWYEPQMVNKTTANTVVKDDKDGFCQYMQLPPAINQPSRLNSNFILSTAGDENPPGADKAHWRPASEWENPIWGWIVVNYADYGIQFFLPNGVFYREVRIGGPLQSLTSPKWTPFAKDDDIVGENTAQLDALLTCLENAKYLGAFWSMITKALDALPPAPDTYAEFLNAIVGKPLALTNIGWSLELDGPAMTNQSTFATVTNPNLPLLPNNPDDPYNPSYPSYQFNFKFGDKQRDFDGLIGYFNPKDTKTEWELSKLYTYFMPDPSVDPGPCINIGSDNYPTFKPFYVQPFQDGGDDNPVVALDPAVYTDRRNRAMETSGQIISAILDPFTAVHAYSSVLPATALSLPPWTWQEAMNKMTAFFHAGPFNTTLDVLDFDKNRRLTTKNMKDIPPLTSIIPVPSLPAGDWNWLQPYPDPDAPQEDASPAYNSYGLDRRGNVLSPGFQPGPYTAVEGFLQLRNPIMQDPTKKTAAPADGS